MTLFRRPVTSGLYGVLAGAAFLSALAFGTAWLVREIPPRPKPSTEDSPTVGDADQVRVRTRSAD